MKELKENSLFNMRQLYILNLTFKSEQAESLK